MVVKEKIIIKSKDQIEKIKKAGNIIAKCHKEAENFLKEGLKTIEIDEFLNQIIVAEGGKSEIKNFHGFPRYSCISVNQEIVHGIPGNYKIQYGDLVSLDLVVSYQGLMADACRTYIIGKVDEDSERLVRETENAFWNGIKEVKEGARLSNISNAIENHAKKHNLSVVKELCGHGVGLELHEDPIILNYGKKNKGPLLLEGMVLAIEPIFCLGDPGNKILKDKWTYVTKSGKNAAHYEHTIAVTKEGCQVLTDGKDFM